MLGFHPVKKPYRLQQPLLKAVILNYPKGHESRESPHLVLMHLLSPHMLLCPWPLILSPSPGPHPQTHAPQTLNPWFPFPPPEPSPKILCHYLWKVRLVHHH